MGYCYHVFMIYISSIGFNNVLEPCCTNLHSYFSNTLFAQDYWRTNCDTYPKGVFE